LSRAFGCDDECKEAYPGFPVALGHCFRLSDECITLLISVEKIKGDVCPDCFSRRTRELLRKAITNGDFRMSMAPIPTPKASEEVKAPTVAVSKKRSKKSGKALKKVSREFAEGYIDTLEAGKLLGTGRTGVWDIAVRRGLLVFKQNKRKSPLMILKSSVLKFVEERNAKRAGKFPDSK
jgi:hypothetical protein